MWKISRVTIFVSLLILLGFLVLKDQKIDRLGNLHDKNQEQEYQELATIEYKKINEIMGFTKIKGKIKIENNGNSLEYKFFGSCYEINHIYFAPISRYDATKNRIVMGNLYWDEDFTNIFLKEESIIFEACDSNFLERTYELMAVE